MSVIKDLTGKRFGRLTVSHRDAARLSNNRTWWICKCDCGKKISVRRDSLISGATKSCGCLNLELTKERCKQHLRGAADISNQKFNMLTAVEPIGKKRCDILWRCICDCGRETTATVADLRSNQKMSCGCLQAVAQAENTKRGDDLKVFGTNIGLITKTEPNKNNKLGIRGVYWHAQKMKYVAYIHFKRKTYRLGYFEDLDNAIEARKAAEQKIFGNFLEWYENQKINRAGR